METLKNLIAAASTQEKVGNLTAVPALLEQAEMLAADLGLHSLAFDLFNAYTEAKVAAWG